MLTLTISWTNLAWVDGDQLTVIEPFSSVFEPVRAFTVAILEERWITVRFCKEQVEDRGLDPRTVADRHDLDVADVYRALTYYHDAMRTVERKRESAIAEHARRTTDPDDIRE